MAPKERSVRKVDSTSSANNPAAAAAIRNKSPLSDRVNDFSFLEYRKSASARRLMSELMVEGGAFDGQYLSNSIYRSYRDASHHAPHLRVNHDVLDVHTQLAGVWALKVAGFYNEAYELMNQLFKIGAFDGKLFNYSFNAKTGKIESKKKMIRTNALGILALEAMNHPEMAHPLLSQIWREGGAYEGASGLFAARIDEWGHPIHHNGELECYSDQPLGVLALLATRHEFEAYSLLEHVRALNTARNIQRAPASDRRVSDVISEILATHGAGEQWIETANQEPYDTGHRSIGAQLENEANTLRMQLLTAAPSAFHGGLFGEYVDRFNRELPNPSMHDGKPTALVYTQLSGVLLFNSLEPGQ